MSESRREYVYKITIDDSQLLRALNRIEGNLERIGSRGARSFGNVTRQSLAMGAAIGAVSAGVSKLIDLFVELGRRGVQALQSLVSESVRLAGNVQAARVQFEGFFSAGGILSPEEIDQAAGAIQNLAESLSVNLGLGLDNATELVRRFLPQVENLEQLERLGELVLFLQTRQPEAAQFAARAIEDAFGAAPQSLRRVFEIPESTIDRLKVLQDELGVVEGTLVALEELSDQFGFEGVETVAGTFNFLNQQAQAFLEILGLAFGDPIVDVLTEALQSLSDIVSENRDEIIAIATVLGETAAAAAAFVATGIIEQLQNVDFEEVFKQVSEFKDTTLFLLEAFGGIISSLSSFSDVAGIALSAFNPLITIWDTGSKILEEFGIQFNFLEFVFGTISVAAAGVEAIFKSLTSRVSFVARALDDIQELRISDALDNLKRAAEVAAETGLRAMADRAEELRNRQAEITEESRTLTEVIGETSDAGEEVAQSYVSWINALNDVTEATSAAEKAQEDFNARLDELNEDLINKLEQINRASFENLSKIGKRFSDQVEDEITKNNDKVEDLWEKYFFDLEKLERTSNDKRAKEARENGRERNRIEQDARNKEAEILREFSRKRDEILREFNRSAITAARDRSIVGVLAAQDARDEALEEARIGRDEDLAESRIDAQQRIEEFRQQQKAETDEIGIAEENRARELEKALEFRLQQQQTAHERRLDQIEINEIRTSDAEIDAAEFRRQEAVRQAELKLAEQQEALDAAIEAQIIAETKLTEIEGKAARKRRILKVQAYKKEQEDAKAHAEALAKITFSEQVAPVQGNILFGGSTGFASPLRTAGVFDSGGVVPGPYGSRQIALVKGGETILPTHRADYQPTSGAGLTQSIFNQQLTIGDVSFGSQSPSERFISREQFLYMIRRMQRR